MIDGPLFIVGHARSGTTVTLNGLRHLDVCSSASIEGHWVYLILKDLQRTTSEKAANCQQRKKPMMLGSQEKIDALYEELGVMIDRYQRRFVGDEKCWVDKTPGLNQLEVLPTLLKIFPSSKVIFNIRSPFHTLESVKRKWSDSESIPSLARRWVRTSVIYRNTVENCFPEQRHLCIRQEDIARRPDLAAEKICTFLDCEDRSSDLERYFTDNSGKQKTEISRGKERVFSIDLPKQVGWYHRYKVGSICRAEMEKRGYVAGKHSITIKVTGSEH